LETFYFSVGSRSFSRGNMQQMVQEFVNCSSGDKSVCNGNNIGNSIPHRC